LDIHLIIQGPLDSLNRRDKGLVFDTRENIKNIIDFYSNLFESITIVTWADQNLCGPLTSQYLSKKKINTLFLKDPGQEFDLLGDFPDNRVRQYYSTLEGILSIKHKFNEESLLLKIRSDQFIDLKDITGQMLSRNLLLRQKIMFPFALSGELDSVGDFFIAGKAELMFYFFQYIYKYRKYPVGSRSVHVDFAQKYFVISKRINTRKAKI